MSNRRQDNPNRRDVHVRSVSVLCGMQPITLWNSNLGNLNKLAKAARLERARHRPAFPHTRNGYREMLRAAERNRAALVAMTQTLLARWGRRSAGIIPQHGGK